ncbi:MAG: VTT domain-containing protein [Candidatus Aminicenantes bacterium]|nr:MAG: VTT domain-containing protein [Candidatus Aminicenantes bacterium]
MGPSSNENSIFPDSKPESKYPPWIKTFLFALQISFVLALLIVWITSNSLQESKSLWVLFFYSFPSEFLIATVPHEPVLLYFGKFYQPLTVALVAIPSTLLTEILNYSTFKFITDLRIFTKLKEKKAIHKTVQFFNKAPFGTLWVAGITPIPFYPLRFLVVLARYPIHKYILAVFLSRFPRFIILAYVGYKIQIPDYLLIALFVALIAIANISILRSLRTQKRKGKPDAA